MDRRVFGKSLLGGATYLMVQTPQDNPDRSGITDVEGIEVGHFTHADRPTGCTVVLTGSGAIAGVDVRGSAPGTRETDLLDPVNTVQEVHAILLAGGSAFGLDAATGVVRYLAERDIGYAVGKIHVPIVPAAILYDLGIGDPRIFPDSVSGYAACEAADNGRVAEGSVGAGRGATVGKMLGMARAMKGGLGTSSIEVDGLVVGAMAAVNCAGDVVDPRTGQIVAGARNEDGGGFADMRKVIRSGRRARAREGNNTTLGIVATNARFTKTEMTKVAQMAQDALARTIYPAHTPGDGDTVFALSTGTSDINANLGTVGALAAEALAEAILRGVKRATSLPGYPSYTDMQK